MSYYFIFSLFCKKVKIICKEHDIFEQTPHSHLSGCGCPKCSGTEKLTTEKFIEKSKELHGEKYDYSKAEYVKNSSKIRIICKEHGKFNIKAATHIYGSGCTKCDEYKFNKITKKYYGIIQR